MDGDEKIGLMLGRASRLRLKITDAIDISGDKGIGMECDAEESLFGIREALESLEKQLASLQDLQQRQRHEREAVLTQIDHSRKALFIKLEEYKGEDLEIIHEAAAFARENVEQDGAFFLPQYPSHFPPDSFVVKDNDPSSFSSKNSLAVDSTQNKQRRMRSVLGFIAKSVITFVGIVSALRLAGFKPEIRKRENSINLLDFLPKTTDEVRELSIHCPSSKVLVIKDGKASCLVKERVEVPFGSDFGNSNINIAFG
ncbi:hypothetical protein KFK09_016426 [Dendrobium nobile]|uniref:Plastid division protein PDV2 n=1 Tax=Dendrobium nobile TaxID=94219 RepID=A0A8T3AZG7_DENNO|nr:hypothetical protein KFK09_016426 [Dendrobium nobile]